MKWDYWIALYINTHCMARGLRALTIKAYEATLKGFRQYAQEQLAGARAGPAERLRRAAVPGVSAQRARTTVPRR